MTSRDEIIQKFVEEVYEKLDEMPLAFKQVNASDKKHMENGFRYAIQSSVPILTHLLDETKKPNAFKQFIDKKLGLTPPTEEDIENEKAKVAMEEQKLELAELRAKKAKLQKKRGGSSAISDFVRNGTSYDPFNSKRK